MSYKNFNRVLLALNVFMIIVNSSMFVALNVASALLVGFMIHKSSKQDDDFKWIEGCYQ